MIDLSNVDINTLKIEGPLPDGVTEKSFKAAFIELLAKGLSFPKFCSLRFGSDVSDGLVSLSMTPSTLTDKPERQYVNPFSSSRLRGRSFANLAVFQISLGYHHLLWA